MYSGKNDQVLPYEWWDYESAQQSHHLKAVPTMALDTLLQHLPVIWFLIKKSEFR
jgi:hypothetical protein